MSVHDSLIKKEKILKQNIFENKIFIALGIFVTIICAFLFFKYREMGLLILAGIDLILTLGLIYYFIANKRMLQQTKNYLNYVNKDN